MSSIIREHFPPPVRMSKFPKHRLQIAADTTLTQLRDMMLTIYRGTDRVVSSITIE